MSPLTTILTIFVLCILVFIFIFGIGVVYGCYKKNKEVIKEENEGDKQ